MCVATLSAVVSRYSHKKEFEKFCSANSLLQTCSPPLVCKPSTEGGGGGQVAQRKGPWIRGGIMLARNMDMQGWGVTGLCRRRSLIPGEPVLSVRKFFPITSGFGVHSAPDKCRQSTTASSPGPVPTAQSSRNRSPSPPSLKAIASQPLQ